MYKKSATEKIIVGRRIFGLLCVALVALLSLYVYFVSSSVINVLVREETERDLIAVHSEVSDLESRYLSLKNEITIDYAYALGFKDLKGKHFTARASLIGRGLTLNNR